MPDDDDDDDIAALFAGIDGPRPLPAGLRDRLVAALSPASMPHPVRRRLERRLVPLARRPWATAMTAVAAAMALVVGLAVVAEESGPGPVATGGGSTDAAADAAGDAVGEASRRQAEAFEERSGALGIGSGGTAGAGSDATGSGAAGAEASAAGGRAEDGSGGSASPDAAAPAAGSAAGGAAMAPNVRVAVIGGDEEQAAGFRDAIAGTQVVATKPGSGEIATVNLSRQPVGAANVQHPLIEGSVAPDGALRGEVFTFASAVDRQAHLAVDALFPSPAPGATATVARPSSGVFADVVAPAMVDALRRRGVTPVLTGPDGPFPDVDAALLALDDDGLRAWSRGAGTQRFERGVATVTAGHDPALVADLPEGTVVLTPFEPLQSKRSSRYLTGLVSGRALVEAVRRSGASTSGELTAALAALDGYDAGGVIPPYEVRPGTRSRTPEARALVVRDGRFIPVGGFRRDPF